MATVTAKPWKADFGPNAVLIGSLIAGAAGVILLASWIQSRGSRRHLEGVAAGNVKLVESRRRCHALLERQEATPDRIARAMGNRPAQ